jgi:hypothetical protein
VYHDECLGINGWVIEEHAQPFMDSVGGFERLKSLNTGRLGD